MSADNEQVVRRFYEELCNGRKPEIAGEIFTDDHESHDPQVPSGRGPEAMAETVKPYQEALNGHWGIEEVISTGDRVVVRWTGSGKHEGELNGIPPTGRDVSVKAISVHEMRDGKIAATHTVWDTLGMLRQLGVVEGPAAAAA